MKRSEMVDILKQELDKYDAPGTSEDHTRLAEHMLSTVELFDMLPPSSDWLIDNHPERMHWDEVHDYYLWEPENE